ncbi:MAG TPA: hypothetical protein VG734_07095 [Lacunisphaera sp.]|nr:hypothetical protein [Lacunisphaera sp.]
MKLQHSFLLAVSACLAVQANADAFVGTMTFTVTATSDHLFTIGETFSGWYGYESPTVDGTFYCSDQPPNYVGPDPTKLYTLRGQVTWPGDLQHTLPIDYPFYGGWPHANYMTVSGGAVSALNFNNGYGPYVVGAAGTDWYFFDDSYLEKYYDPSQTDWRNGLQGRGGRASGTITFSPPARVADAASSAFLLLGSLAGLLIMRRPDRGG